VPHRHWCWVAGRVVETLSSLVDSSLVRAEPSEDEPRFSLLDTIREYALERLRDSGDWQDAHDRHAAHFVALAKPADTELHGAGQLAWLNRLEVRRDNLSAALSGSSAACCAPPVTIQLTCTITTAQRRHTLST
jgi:predicted ATPase